MLENRVGSKLKKKYKLECVIDLKGEKEVILFWIKIKNGGRCLT